MNPILVVSHERSGTHFLINTLAANFGYNKVPINAPQHSLDAAFFAGVDAAPNSVVKSHHQFYAFLPFFHEAQLGERMHIFHIVRDGRDVITSCWNYFNMSPASSFPHTATVGELMRLYPTDFAYARGYTKKETDNLVQRWVTHIDSWQGVEQITLVRYEDLLLHFEQTVQKLGAVLNLDIPNQLYKPTLDDFCVTPWRGCIGTWREFFTEDDFDFFMEFGEAKLLSLGYEK